NDWEIANGLKPDDATGDNGATGDPDHDGMTNLQEYLAGTNPRSASSYLKIGSIELSGNAITLTFEAVANRSYTIEYRNNVRSGPWTKMTDFPAQPFTRTVEIADPGAPASTARFYRVVTPQQP
ncbi:MAG: hypothetical protein DME26_01080, partial [Verrucomicrobia bacterium]